jgi:hypothetical protein
LPKIPTNKAKIILYADDISVIACNPSAQGLKMNINRVFVDIMSGSKQTYCHEI